MDAGILAFETTKNQSQSTFTHFDGDWCPSFFFLSLRRWHKKIRWRGLLVELIFDGGHNSRQGA